MRKDRLEDKAKVRAEALCPNYALMTEMMDLRRALDAEREARLEAERALAEKDDLIARNEMLMREVDHRVKNSLQLVATMLSLHARRLPDGPAVDAIKNAQERVLSIAAVHEQLYQASYAESVDMRVFLDRLCDAIAANRPDNIQTVEVTTDPVTLGSKRAAKIGLLVVELVTNAFKHAYPDGDRGNVRVALRATGEDLELTVSDDGIGLPDLNSPETRRRLGLQIVHSVASQIGGMVSTPSGAGARFVVVVPRD